MLYKKLLSDRLEAKKSGDKAVLSALTTLLGECQRQYKEPTDEQIENIAKKSIKNIKISQNYKFSPDSQVELEILEKYFPTNALSDAVKDEISRFVLDNSEKVLDEKTVGWFVGQIMKKYGGKLDPQAVKDYLLGK